MTTAYAVAVRKNLMSDKLLTIIAARSFDRYAKGDKFKAYTLKATVEEGVDYIFLQCQDGKAYDVPYSFIKFFNFEEI